MGSQYNYRDMSVVYSTKASTIRTGPLFTGVVIDCGMVSRLVRLSFLLILVALLLHLIGFTTPAWYLPAVYFDGKLDLYVTGFGLWEICGTFEFSSFCRSLQHHGWLFGNKVNSAWHYAVQVLVVVGFVFSIVPLVLLILYMIRSSLTSGVRLTVVVIAFVFSLLSGAAVLVAVILYGIYLPNHLGWSFGLSTAAGALFIIGAFVLIPDIWRSHRYHRKPGRNQKLESRTLSRIE